MSKILSFTLLLLFSLGLVGQNNYPQDYFISPLPIKLYSSGTFGELRSNHFHSGLDLKTQGKVGIPVLAAAEGDIVRIKVSPYGFGKALYLRHPNGYTTVYAHLLSFSPDLEAYIISEMRRLQKNEIELYPPAAKFHYNQGDTLALSGNSGGSGGPHLHFEVRDSRTEKIINPLLFGFEVEDHRQPELGPLQVYYFENHQPAGQKEYSLLQKQAGDYVLTGDGIVDASGAVSFGLSAIDRQDGYNNRNGVYDLKLYVGDDLIHEFKMETFAFAESRYINAHIDYGLKACCKQTSHRLYREPGNKLSTYPAQAEAGHLTFDKDTVVPVRIEARDVAGNLSVLNFDLQYTAVQEASSELEPISEEELGNSEFLIARVEPDQAELIKGESYELNIKPGSFYREYVLEIAQEELPETYSDLFTFGSREIPVHLYYDLKLRLNHLPKGVDPSKFFIASYQDGKYDEYEGGSYKDGWISTRTRQLGQFAIALDTLAPEISAIDFKDGMPLKQSQLQIRVRDDLSGLQEYDAWVNGEWVPIYYDAKTDRLLLKTKYWPLSQDSKQVLKLRVVDDKKNVSEQTWTLFAP
ncbi:M23 family metallopeptidase [Croceimicrobium hydrocarbonivorans]|uniref:M23 family metallopeptidase n=1 Tax=Croceimicrobium hydrocarbonivorans TaxID=2761580 RepID=A0A7H0VCQ6_9FLAO|nr:M23 family metallopeptidase [Croceimicrobium hydrocarbonivorans]QNR23504.1 M23 family metallopeptidase [Croceimicrobium hydrocarbonivorans]